MATSKKTHIQLIDDLAAAWVNSANAANLDQGPG